MIYTLKLSTKESIQITEEEKIKFEKNISSSFVKIGDAIINPSFVVSITVDKEATRQQERNKYPRLQEPEKDVQHISKLLKMHRPKFLSANKQI